MVSAALEQRFDVSGENGLADQMERVAAQLVDEYWHDNRCDMTGCKRWVWATSIAGQAALVKPPPRWSLPRREPATGQGRALQSFSTCPN